MKIPHTHCVDEQIASIAGMEVLPDLPIANSFVGDYELLMNLRGLSGNSGKHPFFDCICDQANRNKPKKDRTPCQKRTIEECQLQHEKWLRETKGNVAKVSQYQNCLHPPLLVQSFKADQYRIPILHVCMLPNHDLDKFEGELLSFDCTEAVEFAVPDPEKSTGVFWAFLALEKVVIDILKLLMLFCT